MAEAFPGTDRLFAALTAAAGAGPFADGKPKLEERHRKALKWLEGRPPSKISIPEYVLNTPDTIAYRKTGLLNKGHFAAAASKSAVARSSMSGPMLWQWDEDPRPDILTSVQELCAELGYLGEAVSLAVADAWGGDDALPDALVRVPDDELFVAAAVPVSTPLAGRLESLEAAHAASRRPRKKPEGTVVKNEAELVAHWPSTNLGLVWYRPMAVETGTAATLPWDRALMLEAEPIGNTTLWPAPPTERVAWCVALHRALVRALDPSVPALITGHYPSEVALPANRLAIQILDRSLPLAWDLSQGVKAAFALLLPSDTSAEDQDAVVRGLHAVASKTLYRGKAGALRLTRVRAIQGNEFWSPAPEGTERWWHTYPLAIADTRPMRTRGGVTWTLDDTIKLSVGMVWRDLLAVDKDKGEAFYHSLVAAVGSHVEIASPMRLAGPDLERFVHRMGPSVILNGYRASLRLPGLAHDRAPVAIGQSRHLGTGLLVPVDLPRSVSARGVER